MQRIYEKKEKDILIQMMRDVKTVFDDLGVVWSLSAGGLLGAMRDGKFIPWDYDIDLCMHLCSFPLIQSIYDEMKKLGYGGSLEQLKSHGCFKFAKIDYEKRPEAMIPTIDVYIIFRNRKKKRWEPLMKLARQAWPKWYFPEEDYWPHDLIEFEGITCTCPANPKALLELYYGEGCIENPDITYGPAGNIQSHKAIVE